MADDNKDNNDKKDIFDRAAEAADDSIAKMKMKQAAKMEAQNQAPDSNN